MTYSLASGDLEDLGWESDGALQTKLLVLGTVDEVIRDCITYIRMSPHSTQDARARRGRTLFKVLDVAACEGDADLVEFGGGHGADSIVFFFALSDVTHVGDSGD